MCTHDEGKKALMHRFAAGGGAGRYQMVHSDEVEGILALDVALRRNDDEWLEDLPKEVSDNLIFSLHYGHFLCNVFHQNYLFKKNTNKEKMKSIILDLLDNKGAKYPAEHNVGHIYKAEDSLQQFYIKLDPTNTFNPGIGKTSRYHRNCNCCD